MEVAEDNLSINRRFLRIARTQNLGEIVTRFFLTALAAKFDWLGRLFRIGGAERCSIPKAKAPKASIAEQLHGGGPIKQQATVFLQVFACFGRAALPIGVPGQFL